MRLIVYLLLLSLNGCALVTVVDAAVSVGATAVDVTAAVAKKAVGSDSSKN